jgi:MtN3 and saliva related transmembrane protein
MAVSSILSLQFTPMGFVRGPRPWSGAVGDYVMPNYWVVGKRNRRNIAAQKYTSPQMEMDTTTLIGLVSAFFTTGAYVPQAIKTWRTRRTGDLSLSMFSMVFLGTVGWLVYGLLKDDLPIILANTITLGTSFVILYFKIQEVRAGRKPL